MKSSSPFSSLPMGVQEIEGQLCKATQLEIQCTSRLKRGKSLEHHRSMTNQRRSSPSNTVILVECNEGGCSGCPPPPPPTHTSSTLLPLHYAFLRPRGWKPDYSSGAPHDVALADTPIQAVEGKRPHHGAGRQA